MIRALKYPGTEMERRIIVPVHRWPFITDNIALRRTPDSLLFALKSLFPRCTLRFSYFHSSKCFTGDLSLSLSLSLFLSASFNAFTDVLYHLVENA